MGSGIRRLQLPPGRAARAAAFLTPRRDEQRFLLVIGLCAAAALWLALAWLEPLVLAALPLLAAVYVLVLWAHRRFPRSGPEKEDVDGASELPSSVWRREVW